MTRQDLSRWYDFSGRTFAITGGTGVLCREMARALFGLGANVVILTRNLEKGEKIFAEELRSKDRFQLLHAEVLHRKSLEKAAETVRKTFGGVDGLVNGAGGNHPSAATAKDKAFFDLPEDALRYVTDLNLLGTMLPCQVFGRIMAEQKEGIILNISSMNAFRPLTRIPAYSAAKAAINNFTQWLAVHLAQEYSPAIRVNAIAPGFFLTEQNRFLLYDETTQKLTDRGKAIIQHTPMRRFGNPEDLLGCVLWLLSPASAFVTGVVVPVDGGFSAFSGV